MIPLIPATRPRLRHDAALDLIRDAGVLDPLALLGIRGYYLDTMGAARQNDRGIYDDAIAVVSPTTYATFNANTDPSVTRPGVAVLQPGIWLYQRGRHKRFSPLGYPALVQAGPVTVRRDEQGLDTGWFGINIHRGAEASTSSLGCQTIAPAQWAGFFTLVTTEMARHQQTTIRYVLLDEATRRAAIT